MIIIGIFLYVVAAAVVATILVSLFSFVKKHAAAFGKVVALTAVVVLITVLFGGVFYGALAEDLDVIEVSEFVSVEPVVFNGEALLLIFFEYRGEILSWYEEGEFYPGRTYKVIVFNGIEVIGAELVQEGGEPCFQH